MHGTCVRNQWLAVGSHANWCLRVCFLYPAHPSHCCCCCCFCQTPQPRPPQPHPQQGDLEHVAAVLDVQTATFWTQNRIRRSRVGVAAATGGGNSSTLSLLTSGAGSAGMGWYNAPLVGGWVVCCVVLHDCQTLYCIMLCYACTTTGTAT